MNIIYRLRLAVTNAALAATVPLLALAKLADPTRVGGDL